MPDVPPSLPREVGGALARASTRLRITLAEADARLSVEDVFDEMDVGLYIHDVDHEPQAEPVPSSPAKPLRR